MFVFNTTASTCIEKVLSPVSLLFVTTVLLVNTNDTGDPLLPLLTMPIGEPNEPPKPAVSTRLVTYCIPRGIRSVTTRLLIVPSGNVTANL